MRNEDEFNEKKVDDEKKDDGDTIKLDHPKGDGDKGDDHAGMKEPEVPPAPEAPGVLPERVDIVLAQDLSQSFEDDLGNLQGQFLDNLDAALAAGGATDAAFGITSFIDYPFGAPPADPFGVAGDFIYNTNEGVTENVTTAQTALNNLSIPTESSGADAEEAQLVALQQVALQAEEAIGFRPDAERFVVLSTDDPFHQAEDYPAGGTNDNDTDLTDGIPNPASVPPSVQEDYPSIAQVAEDLAAANITPIFTVQAVDPPTAPDAFDELQIYTDLLADLNAVDPSIGGAVVPLSSDSSGLSGAILAGLTEATAPDDMLIP